MQRTPRKGLESVNNKYFFLYVIWVKTYQLGGHNRIRTCRCTYHIIKVDIEGNREKVKQSAIKEKGFQIRASYPQSMPEIADKD